ncbi:DUF1648 domain-containing protein [Lacticaseibacillus jixianensis]|uniref:DUF1648 domain-containing protein n=1 Tax=Lacticaseibacillus jixianensis TaxID=2486012 RepID=A0ABW4B8I9_9LACO|nr:DUF1648 domain-containing protein [Lacticaseibacillus jixianensis]
MKHFRMLDYGAVAAMLVFTLFLMVIAPKLVVTHFNGAGVADSWSSRTGLLLEPALLLVIALICDWRAHSWRKRDGMQTLPMITFGEWRLLSFVGLALVGFVLIQLAQIGFLQGDGVHI